MKNKMKRYNGEDGSEVEFETKTGENEMISKIPGIREKAMAAVAAGGQKDEEPAPKAKPKAKAEAPKREKANPTYTAPPKMAAADRVKKEREKSAKKSSYTADHSMGNAMRSGGKVSSASKRADGCAIRGKTRA